MAHDYTQLSDSKLQEAKEKLQGMAEYYHNLVTLVEAEIESRNPNKPTQLELF